MSDRSAPPSPLPRAPLPQVVAYGLLLLVLCGGAALLGLEADLSSRAAGLRLWVLVGAGLFAMTPPNILLPDPNTRLLQVLNRPPSRLLRYQLRRLGPVVVIVAVPAAILAFADGAAPYGHLGAKAMSLAQALLLIMATAADSFAHFATLGPRSQAWQEGQAGNWYGRAVEERGQGVSLPRGLVPALFATTRCFIVGLIAVLISAAGADAGVSVATWGPGVVLLAWAGRRLWVLRRGFDRHFYHTTAFYEEVLGGAGAAAGGAGAREPIPYDALYWVPTRWRPATWAGLRQLDRRLPLGRLVALGHAGFWLLCLRGVSPMIVSAYLGLLFIGQVATCGLLTTTAAAPLPFQHTLQSTLDWIATRTFVNLRWLLAHAGSLALVVVFADTYDPRWLLTWAAIHIGFSLTAALVATLAHEGWSRREAAA